MKFLIFSDIHVNAHKCSTDRLNHCLEALEWVFQTAKDKGVRHILFCGDLFHDRRKIDIYTYTKAFSVFEKHLKDRPYDVYLLLGNHDMWFHEKWDVSSVSPLKNIPGVHVIDEPCVRNIGGCDVGFLPYTHNPPKDLLKIESGLPHDRMRVLCAHAAIDGAKLNAGARAEVAIEQDGEMVKVDASIFNGWEQVFVGHYHGEQQLNSHVEYVGSPLQLSFGEAGQHKHIIIYDADSREKTYIRNEFSPRHKIVKQKDIDKQDLKGHFVQVVVDDIADSNLVELRKSLLDKGVGSLDFSQRENKEQEVVAVDVMSLHGDEIIKKYIDSNAGGLDKDKLLTIGKKILARVEIK